MFAASTSALSLSQIQNRIPTAALVILGALNSWNLIRFGAHKPFNAFDGSYEKATAGWLDAGRPMPASLQALMESTQPPRRLAFLSRSGAGLRENADLFGLYSADGDNPFLLLRYYNLRRLLSDDVEWSRLQYLTDLKTPWIRAMSVGYAIDDRNAPTRPASASRYELLQFDSARIYEIKDPLPRFRLENHIRGAGNDHEALNAAMDPAFDPTREAIVEGLPSEWEPAAVLTGSVEVVRYENNRVSLRVQSSGRALLVTSESFYPGWTATVNGRPAEILATNVAFRGIPVEPGESVIVMNYFPQRFYLYLLISVVALTVTVTFLAGSFERSPNFQIAYTSNRAEP
jgi:hypothetical protein